MRTSILDIKKLQNVPENVDCVLRCLAQLSPAFAVARGAQEDGMLNTECEDRLESISKTIKGISASFSELVKFEDDLGPRSTTTLWHTYFRAIGRACYEESVAIGEVDVALPVGFVPMECTASMLVSYAIKDHMVALLPGSGASSNLAELGMSESKMLASASASCSDDDSSSRTHETSYADLENEDDTSLESEFDPDGWLNYELPRPWGLDPFLNASQSTPLSSTLPPASKPPRCRLPRDCHVLAGMGPWPDLILPVFCVTDAHTIIPILSCVAHQRRVWRIDIPVVGIQVSKYSSVARIHVAWLEPPTQNEPTRMHVVRAHNSMAPADGVFDMADPNSGFLLGKFLISLRYQFHTLHASIPSTQPLCLKWRYDSFRSASLSVNSWVRSVNHGAGARWVPAIYKKLSAHHQTHSRPSSHHPSITQQDATMAAKPRPPSSKTDSKGRTLTPPASHSTMSDRITTSREDQSRSSQTSSREDRKDRKKQSSGDAKSKSSHLQSSVFAMESARGIEGAGSITSWMCHRSAISVPVVGFPDSSSIAEKDRKFVNAMVDEYNAMTEFKWPTQWTTEANLPPVNESLVALRTRFYNAYQALSNEEWAKKPLDHTLVPIVEAHFWAVLEATAGTFTQTKMDFSLNEAESRHVWDELLYQFFTAEDEGVSPYVTLERDIMYPANPLLRALRTPDSSLAIAATSAMLESWQAQCVAMATATRRSPLDRLHRQAKNAVVVAFGVEDSFATLSASQELLNTLQRQAILEPKRGTCDAVLCVPVTSRAILSHNKKPRFRLVVCSQRAKETKKVNGEELPDEATFLNAVNSPLYANPLVGPSSHEKVATTPSLPVPPRPDTPSLSNMALLLPSLIAEYKKPSHATVLKALNQTRMYCVSAAHFLAAIGIRESPVFGLATNGKEGVVMMASGICF
ncbi:hypothetical protein BC835DRAFT_1422668 [Cytidiella melzeri]|nr:hypothetical protein BC835DRAFT_1422668 [Cytidiella melzeri]